MKKNPETLVNSLKDVVFQKDIGTIYEKVERNMKIADKISERMGIDEQTRADIKRTVYLSKFDLFDKYDFRKRVYKTARIYGNGLCKESRRKRERCRRYI